MSRSTASTTRPDIILAARIADYLAEVKEKPLQKGKPKSWATGVVMALGHINLLFGKSNGHYIATKKIAAHFGVSVSNAGLRAQQIRDGMDLDRFGPEFSTAAPWGHDPFARMVMVDDMMMPITVLP